MIRYFSTNNYTMSSMKSNHFSRMSKAYCQVISNIKSNLICTTPNQTGQEMWSSYIKPVIVCLSRTDLKLYFPLVSLRQCFKDLDQPTLLQYDHFNCRFVLNCSNTHGFIHQISKEIYFHKRRKKYVYKHSVI